MQPGGGPATQAAAGNGGGGDGHRRRAPATDDQPELPAQAPEGGPCSPAQRKVGVYLEKE